MNKLLIRDGNNPIPSSFGRVFLTLTNKTNIIISNNLLIMFSWVRYILKCNLTRYFIWLLDGFSFLCFYLFNLNILHMFLPWQVSLLWNFSFLKSGINGVHRIFFCRINVIKSMGKWHCKRKHYCFKIYYIVISSKL